MIFFKKICISQIIHDSYCLPSSSPVILPFQTLFLFKSSLLTSIWLRSPLVYTEKKKEVGGKIRYQGEQTPRMYVYTKNLGKREQNLEPQFQ